MISIPMRKNKSLSKILKTKLLKNAKLKPLEKRFSLIKLKVYK